MEFMNFFNLTKSMQSFYSNCMCVNSCLCFFTDIFYLCVYWYVSLFMSLTTAYKHLLGVPCAKFNLYFCILLTFPISLWKFIVL